MHVPTGFLLRIALVAVILYVTGCGSGDGVREDRSIHSAADGGALSFQHGDQGVYVSVDGELQQVYQPTEDVLATSTPLWAPDSGRMIFTVATAVKNSPNEANAAGPEWDDSPDGRVMQKRSIRYACRMHEKDTEAGTVPDVLFEATCDHVGYVAANLAVRWHPDESAIIYLDQNQQGKLELQSWNLAEGRSETAFAHSADAMIFDWAPDNQNLVCVLDDPDPKVRGIWFGTPGEDDWWHVTNSAGAEPAYPLINSLGGMELLLGGQFGTANSPIERLRSAKPAWNREGSAFAFVAGRSVNDQVTFTIERGDPVSREIVTIAESPNSFTDLHWHSDGSKLGTVQQDEQRSLRIISLDGNLSDSVSSDPVRRFVGWNSAGDKLAYVVPQRPSVPESDQPTEFQNPWAFLLLSDPYARDSLITADADGLENVQDIFSGMRLTFPNWSPDGRKLTFWATYSPSYRSWFGRLFGLGMRRGDPAVAFDVETGRLDWMPVNPREKIQIGHYYLMQKDNLAALKWYQEAREELGPLTRPTIQEFAGTLRNQSALTLFQSICLRRLGRDDESLKLLAEFHEMFLPELPKDDAALSEPTWNAAMLRRAVQPDGLWAALLRDCYIAEACLSLNSPEESQYYLEQSGQKADSNAKRLSNAIVVSQLLLLQTRYGEYTEFVTQTLLPAVIDELAAVPNGTEQPFDWIQSDNPRSLVVFSAGLAMLPMFSEEFLEELDRDQIETLSAEWEVLRDRSDQPVCHLATDLFLKSAYARLKNAELQDDASGRLKSNRVLGQVLNRSDISELIAGLRQLQGQAK